MRVATIVPVLLAYSSAVFATCYFPNGNVVDSDTACNPNALVSSCCYDNQACLSNGLCVSDPHDPAKARLHRGTCTDKSWKSGNCVRQCLDTENNGAPVYSCNSTSVDSYCCYDDCECENPFEVFKFNQTPADVYTMTIILESYTQTHTSTPKAVTSTSTASTAKAATVSAITTIVSTSAAPASTTASSTPAAASGTKGDTTNYVALGVGLGVGLGIGIPLILLFAFFFYRRNKGHKPADSDPANPAELTNDAYFPPHEKYAQNYQSEVSGDSVAPEMPASSHEPVELPINNDRTDTTTTVKYH
ncbi:hypothetical protein A1F94_010439 [Pyrenophora tritici-repentis]|uniref:Mucin domain containing protein n=2 Tax=Pyrenophora tritici-repentis TaxID=45151 RepID=A0A2W1FIP9_9PLEO|nr:uncharacterized protein PTRG_07037 [Pyrenophora tritici-repentis Pt-1C-BFP]KAA8614594.1 hypothetical protein PtrV1_11624 [Pyrenophora tritici-repentis]EDU49956.1 predicted protein [Pyrenophora tritici-repentis Pt-1C-BFP]KAF7444427.1 hypothetical protein A1F99_109800 [Pyrenophora tritici-repentis]KAF7564922.1 Mucin domain containing protein [Pyrenophora tritici-repentis]KAG9378670.1 hypothetical protein A1F94_010439 [Pyrenophora tritici-repentis]